MARIRRTSYYFATPFFSALLLTVTCCHELHADTVYLKNGKTMDGEVIKEDTETVTLRVPFGEVKLRKADIENIEHQTPQEYRLDLGRKLLQQRNYDRAIPTLEEALSSDKTNAEARRILAGAYETQGKAYRELRRFNEARESYEKLLKLDPNATFTPHKAQAALQELKQQRQALDTLLKKARGLSAAQEWNPALKIYEDMTTFTPDARAEISTEMAQCYVYRAKEYSQAGRALNAAGDIESALKLDPTLADRVEKFYTSCLLPVILNNLAAGKIQTAEVDLRRALSFAPTNPTVLYIAGRLEEAFNRLPTAADYYARGLRTRVGSPTLEHTAELRQKLEQEIGFTNGQWKIDTEFSRSEEFAQSSAGPVLKLESENFVVFHYNEALAKQVIDAAEYHRTRIQSELKLAHLWKGRTKIYLHRTHSEYTASTGQPEWTGGFSKFNNDSKVNAENTGRIELQIHSWQTSPRLLKSVLPHEITHVSVACNLSDFQVLPRCLHEGFSVLMEPQFRKDYFMNFLRTRLQSQSFIPLNELLASKDYPKDPEFFYAEGYAFLEYLVSVKNTADVATLLKCTSPPQLQSELLKIGGARAVEDLETDWKKWILSSAKK